MKLGFGVMQPVTPITFNNITNLMWYSALQITGKGNPKVSYIMTGLFQ